MKNFTKYLEIIQEVRLGTPESKKIGFNYFKYDNKQLIPLIKLEEKTKLEADLEEKRNLLSLINEEKRIMLEKINILQNAKEKKEVEEQIKLKTTQKNKIELEIKMIIKKLEAPILENELNSINNLIVEKNEMERIGKEIEINFSRKILPTELSIFNLKQYKKGSYYLIQFNRGKDSTNYSRRPKEYDYPKWSKELRQEDRENQPLY